MSRNIFTEIINAKVNYEAITSISPTRVYLGAKEYDLLHEKVETGMWSDFFSSWSETDSLSDDYGIERDTVHGMFIYKVDTPCHLECS